MTAQAALQRASLMRRRLAAISGMQKVGAATGVVMRRDCAREALRWCAVILFSARAVKAVQRELAHFGLAAANMPLDAGKCRGGVASADGVENRAMFLVGLVETIAVHKI